MANVNKALNKVKKALNAKGLMPLINQEQFYTDNGACTKYVLHYGSPGFRNKDAIATVYNKIDLLKVLIELLKAGDNSE